MARKRPVMPSIANLKQLDGIGNKAERGILARSVSSVGIRQENRPQPSGDAITARERALRTMSYDTAMAMQAARQGDDTELLPYQPTPSINPPRPRTLAAGYDKETQTLRIRFRDSAGYEYYGVTPREWRNFKAVRSPGRAINRTLNNHPYERASW